MDPSICANPTFKQPAQKLKSNLKDKMLDNMSDIKLEAPLPMIDIRNLSDMDITVSNNEGLLIVKNSDRILYQDDQRSVFRQILFSFLNNCEINVKTKLTRVFFTECKKCIVNLDVPLIGPLEIFRCSHSDFFIKNFIPVTVIENCSQSQVQQTTSQLYYIITRCERLGIVGPNKKKINAGKIFWDDQERNIFLVEKDNFLKTSTSGVLNEIEFLIHKFDY